MLNLELIEKKWNSIDVEEISGFRYVRLSSDCNPELNIGYNYAGNRCLILELPVDFHFEIVSIAKENLSIKHIDKGNYIVIQLIEESYFDLFNDLILSLYHKIKDIVIPKDYANKFVHSFGKWVEFFENRIGSGLSIEEVKGLYGELFVLNELINGSDSSKINEILNGWVGPYDAPQDFNLHSKHIEVKTKLETNPAITISSEHQLEVESGKDLFLNIVTIRTNFESGTSIRSLIEITIELIRERLGDLSILYTALNEKGITLESLKEFNNYRYSVIKTSTYDCLQENFPRLYTSNIPSGICRLKYRLQISQLDRFLIEEKNY
jgi:hypothetical protein